MTVTNDDIIKAEMNDKELADRVVALDDRFYTSEPGFAYFKYVNDDHNLAQGIADFPEQFVRDWRVAGALMEKCKYVDAGIGKEGAYAHQFIGAEQITVRNESLPRAIIEACVEALSK